MISIIIPAHNAAQTLAHCLNCLQQQINVPDAYEIIVVDDGSTDDTAVIAQNAQVELHQLPQKSGAAAARNVGIKAAKGDIVCFTDADCLPHPNWLAEMIRPFANPDIVGCKGIYESQQPELVARFVQIEYEDKYDLLRQEPFIDFIDTYSAAFRTAALRQYRGFDERIFYVEDQELSFRLAAQAYKMVFQPSAVVGHFHSNTLWKYVRKKFMIGYWKSQIIRRFPERAVKDSHTPQILKVQIILVALILSTLFFSLLFPPLLPASAILGLLFIGTTLSFIRKAWPKDQTVALCSPFLLFVRALGLGFGTAVGLVRRVPNIETIRSSL